MLVADRCMRNYLGGRYSSFGTEEISYRQAGKASSVLSISNNDDNRVRFVSGTDKADKADKIRFRTNERVTTPVR